MLGLAVDTLPDRLPGNLLAHLVVSAALDPSTVLAFSPGSERPDVECLTHYPLMFKETAHD